MKKHGRPSEYQSAIAAIVKEAPRGIHLTAPEVYARARDNGLPVSISTVYRTLQRLKDDGNLSTVAGNRKLRYESADEAEHDHLICLNCGMTIEFRDERLIGFGRKVAKTKGFLHKKSRFDILGFCKTCCSSNSNISNKNKTVEHWQIAATALSEALNSLTLAREKLTEESLSDQEVASLLASSQKIKENLKKALDNCEAADDLL